MQRLSQWGVRLRLRNSLRTKIIVWFFVPTALILLGVALANFYAYQDVTEELVLERDQDLTRLSAAQLATDMGDFADGLSALARSPNIRAADPATQANALASATVLRPVFDDGLVVLDNFGTVTAAGPERLGLVGQDWSGRDHFRQIVRTLRPVFSDILNDGAQGAEVVALAVPITGDAEELLGSVVGLVRVDPASASTFYGEIVKLRIGESGGTYLVDGTGRVIHHSDPAHVGADFMAQPVVAGVLAGQVGAIRTRDFDGVDIVAGFAPVPGTAWGLVSQETWDALTGAGRGYQRLLLLMLALGVAIPAVVVAIGIRRIMRPVDELIGAARAVAAGDFGQTIAARSGDEIQQLAEEFNLMASQLRTSYERLEQTVADRTRQLQESEERLRTVIASAPVVLFALDSDGVFTLSEGQGLAALGLKPGEVVGRSVFELYGDVPDITRDIRLALAGEEVASTVRVFGLTFDSRYSPLRREDGTVSGLIAVSTDVTERARAEEALRLRAEELEALFAVASIVALPETFQNKVNSVVVELAVVIEGDRVVFRLADDEQQGLRLVASAGAAMQEPPPAAVVPYGDLLAGKAFESEQPVVVNDYASYPEAEAARVAQGIRSAIAVPVGSGGRTMGTIVVNSLKADHFTIGRVRVLSAVASGMGVLIENAGLLESMRESEERYRSLFEDSSDAVFINAREGEILEINQAATTMFGFTRDEMVGMDVRDIYVDIEDRHALRLELERVGSVREHEAKLKTKDGRELDCLITATARRGRDGSFEGIQGTVRDVTEQKRAEELFRTVAESSPVAMYLVQDGKFSFVNQEFQRNTGYSADEIVARDAMSFVRAEDQPIVEENLAKTMGGEPVQPFEYRAYNRAGDMAWHLGTGSLIEYHNKPAMLGSFSDITARKLAEEETRQLAHENSVVAEIGRVISSSLDVDEVYSHFAGHVRELIPFDRIDVTLPDSAHGTVTHAYTAGAEAPGRRRGDVYPLAGTATEQVFRTQAQMLFNPSDLAEVDRRYPGLKPAFQSGMRSFITTPLISRNQVIGVFHLASAQSKAYTPRDMSMAQRVGSQIAGAVANAQLYNERALAEEEARQLADESGVMAEIGRVIGSSLKIEDVYDRFADRVQRLIPFDAISIMLVDADLQTYRVPYVTGVQTPERQPDVDYSLKGTATLEACRTRKGVLFQPGEEREVEDRFPGLLPRYREGIRSFLLTPLTSADRTIGVVFLNSLEPNSYSEDDLERLERIGAQIAGAVANAQLYAERIRAEEAQASLASRLNVLNEIMQIALSNLNVTEVFDGVSGQVKRLIDHDRLSIDLLQRGPTSSELVAFAAVGSGTEGRGVSMPLASPPGEVVRTGQPVLRADLSDGTGYPIEAEFAESTGIRSAMFVPLASRDRVLGCLTFSSMQPGSYNERELRDAQDIADHLAVIVEHAQLFEQTKRAEERLRAINEVALSTLSVLRLDELLPYVTRLLHETFGYEAINIVLTDEDSEYAVLRATLGQPEETLKPGFKLKLGDQGIIGWVAKTGEPVLANDVAKEPRYHVEEVWKHINSELTVPIKQGDNVLGVLDIESSKLNAFDSTDVSTAQSLATQLAVAIENARLFEETRDLAVLEERNRMAREIHDTMAQGFTGIVLQLEAAEQAYEEEPAALSAHLDRAKRLARECLQEARRSVWNLLPRALEERPLGEALEEEVARWRRDGEEEAHFTLSGVRRELEADIQAALLRICQESLTNIRKHAGASTVTVSLEYLTDSVTLEVRDDGVGFDVNAEGPDRAQGGFGLLGMEQRARLIRANLNVRTQQGQGTTISVEVPTV